MTPWSLILLVHVLLKLQRQNVHAEKSYKIDKKYLKTLLHKNNFSRD